MGNLLKSWHLYKSWHWYYKQKYISIKYIELFVNVMEKRILFCEFLFPQCNYNGNTSGNIYLSNR